MTDTFRMLRIEICNYFSASNVQSWTHTWAAPIGCLSLIHDFETML